MSEEKKKPTSGRKSDQKMKPYLVYDYLMRNTNANHVVSGEAIAEHINSLGISAERRSIYKDIEEINKAILLTTRDVYGLPKAETLEEAEELLKDPKQRTIIYDERQKGYYVRKRHYKVNDIRALAECVYSAKFIDEKRARRLVNVICDLVSDHDAEGIRRDVILLDRGKTDNAADFEMLKKISLAMTRKKVKKQPHVPEKIRFKYMTYTIQNGLQRTERYNGRVYSVSPYQLLISDGNYYLIGYDDRMKMLVHFRVDRMKDLELTGEPRSGEDEFKTLDMDNYLKKHFGMFGGEMDHITIRAENRLLDTFVDRFGKQGVIYAKDGDKHFTAVVHVAVSKQFYGWLCGLGGMVQIVSPEPAVEKFKQFLDEIRGLYE